MKNFNAPMISKDQHLQITAAIRKAESKTSGEIFAVVASQSDDYFYVAGFMSAFWALLLGCIVAAITVIAGYELSVLVLAGAQLLSFASTLGLLYLFPHLKIQFVPRSVAYKRASNNAVRQFLAHGIHTTSERSGVLIFVSLIERYAEIVADEGINSRVDQSQWDLMVGTLIDQAKKEELAEGFVVVVGKCGELLAEHFPPTENQQNELDDRLVEL